MPIRQESKSETIYLGTTTLGEVALPLTRTCSPCMIFCCYLNDMIDTEGEDAKVVAPLALEKGGAA